jgi:hypothetical protein
MGVTGRGGPQGFESSSIPNLLNSQLRDGAEVVRLTRRPTCTPRLIPDTEF